ncbi:MAG: hypothetical protein JKY37_17260 [Nannocystaceae bacterium]|nr:hypothetical protein [Nannocystaceae bacterium]
MTIESNEELEALLGVTEINGDLLIEGAVTTLGALDCLRHVRGTLGVKNTELSTFEGLQQLVSATTVEVHGNGNLRSFASLGIVEVEGLFWIYDNPSLEEVQLDLTEYVGGLIIGKCFSGNPAEFSGNDVLTKIRFPGLAGGQIPSISLAGNPSLTTIDGILEWSSSIVLLDLLGNTMLDSEAVRTAWIAAGKDADLITTCGNLGDVNLCICTGTE